MNIYISFFSVLLLLRVQELSECKLPSLFLSRFLLVPSYFCNVVVPSRTTLGLHLHLSTEQASKRLRIL